MTKQQFKPGDLVEVYWDRQYFYQALLLERDTTSDVPSELPYTWWQVLSSNGSQLLIPDVRMTLISGAKQTKT